jgi:diguanylate cyclase (GGDEF)-like protein
MKLKLDRMSIGSRLALGFGVVGALLAVAVAMAGLVIDRIDSRAREIVATRLPATEQSLIMAAHFTASTSAVYRYVLTRNPQDLAILAGEWSGIVEAGGKVDAVSDSFTPKTRAAWKSLMSEFDRIYRVEYDLVAEADRLASGPIQTDAALTAGLADLEQRIGSIQTGLRGQKDEHGVRRGGLSGNQATALTENAAQIQAGLAQIGRGLWALCAVSLAVSALIAWATSLSIVTPILRITETMELLAKGRLDLEIPATARRDEVGSMAASVEVFRQNAVALHHSAYYDSLTGLPNRAKLAEEIETRRALQHTVPDFRFAILLLDIDNFRMINTSLDHRRGDELLISLARRLDEFSAHGGTVARFGGDKFVVVVQGAGNYDFAERAAKRLLDLVALPIMIAGSPIAVRASVGIVYCEDMAPEVVDMLRDADTALYQAKSAGGSRQIRFERSMYDAAAQRLQIEIELQTAIERGEFELFYQPIVHLSDRRLAGFEALIRWRHPTKGLVSPGLFIPVAEQTGQIIDIGRWALIRAVEQLAELRSHSAEAHSDLFCTVNVSARQLADDPEFLELARRLMDGGLVAPGSLKLELTESLMVQSPELAAQALTKMVEFGLKLAIDDFGTGYSSLSHLHRFPFHTLKIDRSFVMRLGEDDRSTAVVEAISDLAHTFGMDVVAEGIERAVERALLIDIGCEYGQGYLFGRPMPFNEAAGLLRQSELEAST